MLARGRDARRRDGRTRRACAISRCAAESTRRVVLGGRGTLLVAGIGGYDGSGVKRGDRVASADADADASAERERGRGARARTRARARSRTWRWSRARRRRRGSRRDRRGHLHDRSRLRPHRHAPGRARAAAAFHATARDRKSTPMVPGAIELTPSGLVVLGPDHPTTGGYPVVAVVAVATALGALLRDRSALPCASSSAGKNRRSGGMRTLSLFGRRSDGDLPRSALAAISR